MNIIKKNAMNRLNNFIMGLKKDDKVAVLHHTDPDGVSSAVIMSKLVEKSRSKGIDLRLNQKPGQIDVTFDTLRRLKANQTNKLIITDLCVDQSKINLITEIEKFAHILIIDHHKLYHDLNSEKTIHIKPQMLDTKINPSSYPASKLAFDLGSAKFDIHDLNWVAALGLFGDNAAGSWKSFIGELVKEKNEKNNGGDYMKELCKATQTLFLTESYDYSKVGECFAILFNSKEPKDVINSNLSNYCSKVEDEINYWQKNFEKSAEFYDNAALVFDHIHPKYSIKSAIISAISNKYPDKTVVIAEDSDNGYISLSARRKDNKIRVNDLLEQSLRIFQGAVGGGHVNSAGGRLKKSDLSEFKHQLLNLLGSFNIAKC